MVAEGQHGATGIKVGRVDAGLALPVNDAARGDSSAIGERDPELSFGYLRGGEVEDDWAIGQGAAQASGFVPITRPTPPKGATTGPELQNAMPI